MGSFATTTGIDMQTLISSARPADPVKSSTAIFWHVAKLSKAVDELECDCVLSGVHLAWEEIGLLQRGQVIVRRGHKPVALVLKEEKATGLRAGNDFGGAPQQTLVEALVEAVF